MKKAIKLLLFLFVITSIFWLAKIKSNSLQNRSTALSKKKASDLTLKNKFLNDIKTGSAQKAYANFKKDYQAKKYGETHDAAHIFGDALYRTIKLDGVAVCDSTFGYGCYHSFFAVAISENGKDVIKKLHATCLKNFGEKSPPCLHGLGHGVMYNLGYDKLNQALEECYKLSQAPVGGCSSGVFMEYNFKTMNNNNHSEAKTRELDQNNPYEPCDKLSAKFQPSCYFEQTQWWEAVYKSDYKKVGQLCSDLAGVNKNYCFTGVGNFVSTTLGYDVDKIIASCSEMPDPQATASCSEGASWILLGYKGKNDARKICESLSDGFSEECIKKLKANSFYKE